MKRNGYNRREFYVVQFIEIPFEGIDDYVCVPYTWMVVRRALDQKAAVAYPKNENPFDTRDRVKRKERYDDEWRFYMAAVKYESDTYEDAEYWIATRNDYGPSVEKKSTISNTPSRFRLNKKLRSANESNSSKCNDHPRKPLPKISIKLPALSGPKKQLDGKRLKLDESAQSSVVNDANADPGCLKKGQSLSIQDNQLMECAQTKEAAAAFNGDESTEPRTQTQPTEENKQALSLPVIDVDEPTEVININGKDHSQDFKMLDENSIISQRHLSNNTTDALIIAAEPSTLAEQTTQPNQHDNQEHVLDSGSSLSNFQPRIENVRSMAPDYNNHELHVNDVLNNEPASHRVPDLSKMSAHLYSQMNRAQRLVPTQEPVKKRIHPMNFTKNLPLAAQSPLNSMEKNGSPSTQSVAEQSSVVTQSRSQNSLRVQEMCTKDRREQTTPSRSISISSQDIQHVPKINVGQSQNVAAVDPKNVLQSGTNVALALQTPASSLRKRPSVDQRLDRHYNLVAQEQNLTRAHQNQYMSINQNSFKQDLLIGSPENNIYNHQSNSRTIRTTIPSMKQNSTHPSNPMHQTSELSQQRQSQPNQQDSQQHSHRPSMRIGISIKPKNNRRIPTLQGVTKKTPPTVRPNVLSSIPQALSTTNNNYLLNALQSQATLSTKSTEYNHTSLPTGPHNVAASAAHDNHNLEMSTCSFQQSPGIQQSSAHRNINQNLRTQRESVNQYTGTNLTTKRVHFMNDVATSTIDENYLKVTDNACQTNECMMEESLSPHDVVTSDSDAVTDHEVISDHEISTDEAPVETMNNQTHPKIVLEQQMLDNFSTLFTQMGSTLRYTCDMYNNLRSSILETADTYRNLLDAVERFNGVSNSTSNASSLSNSTPIVPQATEGRHIEVTARANSGHENQHSNNVSDKAPKKIHNNLRRFVLPPEYDPHDTRWTLKYPTNLPGLVELMPQSDIYVSYGELKYCQQVSKDCKSLARRLLTEVFNKKALSVCLSMSEKAQASNNVGSNLRPELDEHASKVLLNFVIDYGLQCGWNTDLKPILDTLHSKIQDIRLRSGVMVKC
uniref:BEN domain-containing protein n=1 Tax=Glyptapanteles indiensis TaxID=92994 RepID=A0JCX9_GLYIN|nr:hypothetical protein GIP_L1_00580 [Glyptapanteles indiensis]